MIFANQISKKIYITKQKIKKQKLFCVSKNKKWKHKVISDRKYCLVTPEGLDSENIKLFNFISDYLKEFDDLKFLWRFHPIYFGKENSFIKKILKNFSNFKNKIILSNNSIDYDFKISKFLLYRGSTTVVKGLSKNLIPINLKIKNGLQNNYFLDSKNFSNLVVTKPKDLNKLILDNKMQNKILSNKKKNIK